MLRTVLNGVTMKNPVIAASGTFGFGREYNQFFDICSISRCVHYPSPPAMSFTVPAHAAPPLTFPKRMALSPCFKR